jgi:hypothetical protein
MHPSRGEGANFVSFTEARETLARSGACEERFKP